ncbi:MAG: phosphoglycerate kinase [Chloroflexi bacterium]|nr:phosphoglycerate kinase [Chloroflexota bacterium]
MTKKTVRDINVSGKRVLVRVDFNVPLENGRITDDTRIRESLPTIKYLMEKKAKVILCSHLGRPKGPSDELRMAPVAGSLSHLLGAPVKTAHDCIGSEAERAVEGLRSGDILLLENLRFHPEEEQNDPDFARALASLADVFVNDAFGTAHRAHASTVGVTHYLPSVAGFLMEKELEFLDKALNNPVSPFAAIMGGAKISDKIPVLEYLLGRVDSFLIGGGMAATFLKAKHFPIGQSLVEEERLEFAADIIQRARQKETPFLLPVDLVIAKSSSPTSEFKTVLIDEVPEDWRIMDIGPKTVALFQNELRRCKTVIWNGPMGVFEFSTFAHGTRAIAQILADLDAITVVGGGSTAEAVVSMGLASRMTHVSTGGGASLRFMEGKPLPGVEALLDRRAPPVREGV